MDLGEKLGRFQAQIMNENPVSKVVIEYAGELAGKDAAPVTCAFLARLLKDVSARVNVVNALHIADERGIQITTRYAQSKRSSYDIRTVVSSALGEQIASGLMFKGGEGRITEIGNFSIEVVPSSFMLMTKNKDIPGVIGKIGTLLGETEVNISRFYLGREAKGGEDLAIIEIDSPLEENVLADLRNLEAFNVVHQVKL
ncbi:MAG: hypothetical protein LH614_17410 [Pyrinomonadaceae bacterium]|nr:hypothetical protein [Pyrinomonadaceae bacterium]